jgi:hypothetical protein
MLGGVVPHLSIASSVHAQIVDVRAFRVHIGQKTNQAWGEVLVEEQPQRESSATNLCSKFLHNFCAD